MRSGTCRFLFEFHQIFSRGLDNGLRNARQRSHLQSVALTRRPVIDGMQEYDMVPVFHCPQMHIGGLREFLGGLQVSVPVRMDDGRVEVFDGKRLEGDFRTPVTQDGRTAKSFQVLLPVANSEQFIKRLEDAGAACVMPLGAPIGSGLGVLDPYAISSVVAASSGRTISGTPFCHWPTRNSPSGRPWSSQVSGPRIVSTSFSRSQSASSI